MPLLKLETTVVLTEEKRKALLAALSKIIAETIGKPEQYVMVTSEPGCHADVPQRGRRRLRSVRSIGGLTGEVNQKLSQKVCKLLNDSLGVPENRVYVNFTDVEGEQLGLEGEHVRVMAMDLPEAKGTYVLIASVAQMKRLEIGRLGAYDIVPGFYAYVGSALGAGGLRARIGHHLESTASPHWHIDYLLRVAQPVEVWYTTAKRKLEHHWADPLQQAPNFRIPIPRFGSSDYHRSRSSHLFHSKRRPSFRWFQQQIREQFDDIQTEQHLINHHDAARVIQGR